MSKRLMRFVGAFVAAAMLCALPTFALAAPEATTSASTEPLIDTEANAVNVRQLPDGSFLYEITIDELASADAYYDGQLVVITGEVMGDRVIANLDTSNCWLTLYSLPSAKETYYTPSSIEVFATRTLTEGIDTYGAYKKQGSTVQVRGTFHLACVEHEGISDVHAQQITVTQHGSVQKDAFDPLAFVPGLALLVVGGVLALVYRRMRERQR